MMMPCTMMEGLPNWRVSYGRWCNGDSESKVCPLSIAERVSRPMRLLCVRCAVTLGRFQIAISQVKADGTAAKPILPTTVLGHFQNAFESGDAIDLTKVAQLQEHHVGRCTLPTKPQWEAITSAYAASRVSVYDTRDNFAKRILSFLPIGMQVTTIWRLSHVPLVCEAVGSFGCAGRLPGRCRVRGYERVATSALQQLEPGLPVVPDLATHWHSGVLRVPTSMKSYSKFTSLFHVRPSEARSVVQDDRLSGIASCASAALLFVRMVTSESANFFNSEPRAASSCCSCC